MTTRTHRGAGLVAAAISLAAVAAAATACAGTDGTGQPDRPTHTSDITDTTVPGHNPGTVAIRVDVLGGMVAPDTQAVRLPKVVVYEDGRVISQDPASAVEPGPALPAVQLRRISAADVRGLVERAVAAGAGGHRDFGQPRITDSSSTLFTVRTSDGVRTTSVYALSEYSHVIGGSGLTARQRSARKDLQRLLDALIDLPATLGPRAVSDAGPYVPAAVAALVEPVPAESAPIGPVSAGPVSAESAPAGPMAVTTASGPAWPGPPLPGEPFGSLTRITCATVRGDQARAVLAAASTAVSTALWTSDGRQWRIRFRPLLPEESGCADLLP
ncbi:MULTISPECIES: hypothetical protein [Parafrankia]|nr:MULTISPECIES: hypothetical protein [Parafrankia]MBE3203284.1 cold shock domain-containing protein [Parafrankia sp. CH37]